MTTPMLIGIILLGAGVVTSWAKRPVWAYALILVGLMTLLGSVAVDGRYDARHCHTSGTITRCDPSPDRS